MESGDKSGTATRSFLSGIQAGKRDISPKTTGKLIKALDLDQAWIDRFLRADTTEITEITAQDQRTGSVLLQADKSGATDRLYDAGITENAIIRLAQRIANDIEDIDTAWLELQNAMEIAVRVQQEGHQSSNHPDFVDEVLQRSAELAANGEYTTAGDEIAAVLEAEREATIARQETLLTRGVQLAMLEGNPQRAAELIVAQAGLRGGGEAERRRGGEAERHQLKGCWPFKTISTQLEKKTVF